MRPNKEFSERLYAAQNAQELCELLSDVNERANADGEFRPRRIRLAVYTALRDNLGEDANEVREVMLDLWHLGMGGDREVEPSQIIEEDGQKVHTPSRSQEDVWERHEARELLGKWMGDWTDVGGTALREELCDLGCKTALNPNASIAEIKAACWTLGEIGWRSEQVEETFWTLLDRDDLAGDLAGSVLVNLGLETHQREAFVTQLRERAKKRPVRYNSYPMQRLGMPELVDDALALVEVQSELSWYNGKPLGGSESADFEKDMKHTFLSHLADELWQFGEAQDKIWRFIFERSRHSEEGRSDLLFTGNLAPWCDSSALVSDFLSVLPDVFGDERQKRAEQGKSTEAQEGGADPHHFTLHVAAERLRASVRPGQLGGWHNVSDELLAPFARLAIRNTYQGGSFSTSPMRTKEDCWEMLAFAGGRWNSEAVQSALSDESSDFVRGHIAETIACFGCDPLPTIVIETLTQTGDGKGGTRDVSGGEDSSLFFSCRGMENIARATANRTAFTALLGFNFVYGGDVLRSTNDALNEVAAHLTRAGDSSVVDALWGATTPQVPLHRRETAISALHHLAHQRLLPPESWTQFAALAQDSEIDDYFRALAVEAIGFLPDEASGDETLEVLSQLWISHRDSSKPFIARSARESLARHGLWQRLPEENKRLFLTDLELEEVNGSWRAPTLKMATSEDMAALHSLYQQSQQEFELAVCDVLAGGLTDPAYAVTWELINANQRLKALLSDQVVRTMLSQLHPAPRDDRQGAARSVKRYLFDALSLGAPRVLLEEKWEEVLSQWPAEVKVALADTMGRADVSESDLKNAELTLETLAHDGSFVVRRSAFRAAKTLMPAQFHEWCQQWSQSEWVFERCVAAEAVFGLDDAPKDIVYRVLNDREGAVRDAARKSVEANRQRQWADFYLAQIEAEALTASTPGSVFAYGAALQKVGDDGHLHRLKHPKFEVQSPAVRFWWNEVTEGLEKEWRNRTRDWNHLGEGVISLHDDATLVNNNGRIEIEIWLWEQPRAGVRSRSSWGGHFRVKDASHVSSQSPEEVFVELRDGRSGKISIGNSHWSTGTSNESRASFSGQGALSKRA